MNHDVLMYVVGAIIAVKLISTAWGLKLRRRGADGTPLFSAIWWTTKITPPLFIAVLFVNAYVTRDAYLQHVCWFLAALVAVLLPIAFYKRFARRTAGGAST